MNTHETYVSLETAKLLDKAGFDWETHFVYDHFSEFNYVDECPHGYKAPTLAVAQRWLREIHQLEITVYSISQESWHWHITKPHQDFKQGIYEGDFYDYEEALEDGIKEALLLLSGQGKIRYFLDIPLEDDDTETGGISYIGETLRHFLLEIGRGEDENGFIFLTKKGLTLNDSIQKLDSTLKECGIKPLNFIS